MTLLKKSLLVLLVLAVCVYVLVFTLSNTTLTDIDFVFITLNQVPVELTVLASFVLGGLCGLLAAAGILAGFYRKYRRLLKNTRQTL